MKKAQKEGYQYEKKIAKKRGVHVGGPGQPDYKRGNIQGEVKATKHPVDKEMLKNLLDRKIKEVESKNGFTKPAQDFGQKNNMKLTMKGKLP